VGWPVLVWPDRSLSPQRTSRKVVRVQRSRTPLQTASTAMEMGVLFVTFAFRDYLKRADGAETVGLRRLFCDAGILRAAATSRRLHGRRAIGTGPHLPSKARCPNAWQSYSFPGKGRSSRAGIPRGRGGGGVSEAWEHLLSVSRDLCGGLRVTGVSPATGQEVVRSHENAVRKVCRRDRQYTRAKPVEVVPSSEL
jgi:hypothetical protein